MCFPRAVGFCAPSFWPSDSQCSPFSDEARTALEEMPLLGIMLNYCVCKHVCPCPQGGQRKMSGALHCHAPLYFLDTGSLIEPGSLAANRLWWSSCLCPHSARRVWSFLAFYMGSGIWTQVPMIAQQGLFYLFWGRVSQYSPGCLGNSSVDSLFLSLCFSFFIKSNLTLLQLQSQGRNVVIFPKVHSAVFSLCFVFIWEILCLLCLICRHSS